MSTETEIETHPRVRKRRSGHVRRKKKNRIDVGSDPVETSDPFDISDREVEVGGGADERAE